MHHHVCNMHPYAPYAPCIICTVLHMHHTHHMHHMNHALLYIRVYKQDITYRQMSLKTQKIVFFTTNDAAFNDNVQQFITCSAHFYYSHGHMAMSSSLSYAHFYYSHGHMAMSSSLSQAHFYYSHGHMAHWPCLAVYPMPILINMTMSYMYIVHNTKMETYTM